MPEAIQNELFSQLIRLRKDESILERLYTRLDEAGPRFQAVFIKMLADVQERAERLDRAIDNAAAVA
ncbi:MAG: hypothetical protein ABSH09_11280 [Bryobacteraceae bacterium]